MVADAIDAIVAIVDTMRSTLLEKVYSCPGRGELLANLAREKCSTQTCQLHSRGIIVATKHVSTDTGWASQDQIETQKRAGRRQFEELDAEKLTQRFYDQSGEDYWA